MVINYSPKPNTQSRIHENKTVNCENFDLHECDVYKLCYVFITVKSDSGFIFTPRQQLLRFIYHYILFAFFLFFSLSYVLEKVLHSNNQIFITKIK